MAELRRNDFGAIDEVVAENCSVHLERMMDDLWFLDITDRDGAETRLWIGSRSGRAAVDVRAETTGTK